MTMIALKYLIKLIFFFLKKKHRKRLAQCMSQNSIKQRHKKQHRGTYICCWVEYSNVLRVEAFITSCGLTLHAALAFTGGQKVRKSIGRVSGVLDYLSSPAKTV